MKPGYPLWFGCLLMASNVFSQNADSTQHKAEKISINITREMDGKKEVIDTIFYQSDEENMKSFLDRHGIDWNSNERKSSMKVIRLKGSEPDKEIIWEQRAVVPDLPGNTRRISVTALDPEVDEKVFSYSYSDKEIFDKSAFKDMEKELEFTDRSGKIIRIDKIKEGKKRKRKDLKTNGKRIIIIEEI